MENLLPVQFYKQQLEEKTAILQALKKKQALIGWARLAVICLLAGWVFWQWGNGLVLVTGVAVVLLAVFLYLVSLALATSDNIRNIQRLISINQEELQILDGKYTHRPYGGAFLTSFQLPDNDLDLFGKASLFQYINRSGSYHGQLALALSFIKTPQREDLLQKQAAVQELATQTLWNQQLQSYGSIEPVTQSAETVITGWLADETGSFDKPVWHFFRFAVPVISFTTLFLYWADIIPEGLFTTILILMLAFTGLQYKAVTQQYSQLGKIVPQLKAFLPLLQWIEKAQFQSGLLGAQQQQLKNGTHTASEEIAALQAILKRLDYRLNPVVYIPLSIFLFWDLQQVLALEKWKKKQTAQIGKWFEAAGNMEMLASLATLAYNQPKWVWPKIATGWFSLECQQAGHPLIKEAKLVANSFSMKGTPSIALVTGSNMAGKSTFLRTVGANMVLAMAGAPVRASHMVVPVVKTISSMRIMDNLEEESSTFHAELMKMKRIVEAANEGQHVFILIDEMLRGTNTYDRHTGSLALIKQLVAKKAVGIVATHDVALATLEDQYPGQVTNYHFDSTIVNEEIIFDYKIKDGVCQSTNASLLMKKIGIEI